MKNKSYAWVIENFLSRHCPLALFSFSSLFPRAQAIEVQKNILLPPVNILKEFYLLSHNFKRPEIYLLENIESEVGRCY